MIVCAIVGLLLNIMGTAIAGRAIYLEWRAHGQGRPLMPWLVRAVSWVRIHVLRRRRTVHALTGTASIVVSAATGSVTALTSPPETASVDERLAFLFGQVRALHQRIAEERGETHTRLNEVEQSIAQARNDAQEAVTRVEQMARDIAIGSVQLQMIGLVLIGLGSVVSVLPAVFGWQ